MTTILKRRSTADRTRTLAVAGMAGESKVVKGSEPFGITVDAEGDPWYAMMSANRIGEFQLR